MESLGEHVTLLGFHHVGSHNHIVKSLFALGERDHDEANRGNDPGENLRE